MQSHMQAAVVEQFGQPLVIQQLPIPVPGAGQILVKTEACGVCHTDLHAAQAKQINEKLNDMRVATEASWEQMVDSTEALHHALVASLHYFKAELKSHKSTKEEK